MSNPLEALEQKEIDKLIRKCLSFREYTILQERIIGEKTYMQIAKELNVSRERVRQLLLRVVKRLQGKLPKEYRLKCLHKKTWRHFSTTYCLQCGEKWEDKKQFS